METVSWERVDRLLRDGRPFVQPIGGMRGAQLVWDGQVDRISLQLPMSPDEPVPRVALAHVSVHRATRNGRDWLVVEGRELSDLQPFHHLAVQCTTHFEADGVTAGTAINRGLETWEELLSKRSLLSEDAQLGLRGELAVLRVLIAARGPSAVESWTAYNASVPGRHDFRLDDVELEVKTTRKRDRHHWIHGAAQLQPSPGCQLRIVSLQFEHAGLGQGISLPECVAAIRASITDSPEAVERLKRYLDAANYRDGDASHYVARWLLASEPRLIPVDESVPRLTREQLTAAIPPVAFPRLLAVNYEINCEGLGLPPSHAEFQAVFGSLPIA